MPTTTRRPNGGKHSSTPKPSRYTTATTTTKPQHTQSTPFLTLPEFLFLITYPALLLLGSLFSLLDPSARSAPYSTLSQSHPPDQAPNYFALKRNVFNQYFVKVGWFWFTVAWALWVGIGPGMVVRAAGGKKRSEERVVEVVDNEDEKFGTKEEGAASWVLTPQRLRSILRWACVTVWWMVVTQWFFGPALIDRGFTFTGGACELIRDESSRMEMGEIKEFVTAATCKIAGGQWKGGHDVSGHVFILVLGSASVGLEILGSMIGEQMRSEGAVDEGEGDGEGGQLGKWGWGVVVGVVGMSWWMLLMTAAYFHTWFEKFTGLLTASLGLTVVYIFPRLIPGVRDVLGIPGQ